MAKAGHAWTDIPLCVLVGSNSESVLRQTLASALVRSAHELGVDLQVFIVEKLQYEDVQNKLPIIDSVKTTLSGQHTEVQWDTLRNEMLSAFQTTEVYGLIEIVEQKWESAERTIACDELVFGLVQDVVKGMQHKYCELINVTSQNSETNRPNIHRKLHSIRLIRNKIVHEPPHSFSGHDKDGEEFLTDYKETMTYCVRDLQCYPLRCEEHLPNLLELESTFDVYTQIIEAYKTETAKNSENVEVLKILLREWKQLKDKATRATNAKIIIKELADRLKCVTAEGLQGDPNEKEKALEEAKAIAEKVEMAAEMIPSDGEGQVV